MRSALTGPSAPTAAAPAVAASGAVDGDVLITAAASNGLHRDGAAMAARVGDRAVTFGGRNGGRYSPGSSREHFP